MLNFKKNKSLIVAVSIIVICGLVSIVGLGKAEQQKSEVAELTELANALGDSNAFVAGLEYLGSSFSGMLGGGNPNRLPNGYLDTGYGYYVDGTEVIDEDGFIVSNAGVVTEGEIIVTLSATSSAATINPVDDTIYVYDAYLYITDATTTEEAMEYLVGTSSVAYISPDTSCGSDGTCAGTTGHEASILITGDLTTGTTLNDTYFKADYQGTDTTDGSGTRYVVPIKDDEYATVFASSTTAYIGGTGQGATAVLKYYSIAY